MIIFLLNLYFTLTLSNIDRCIIETIVTSTNGQHHTSYKKHHFLFDLDNPLMQFYVWVYTTHLLLLLSTIVHRIINP